MLADNIIFLKKNYPVLYEALKNGEDKIKKSSIVLEDTKNNYKTLKMTKGDKSLYLHSKYDPIREAETIIDKLEAREEIDEKTHVIFYGLGLGYHIDNFVKRFPDTTFSLYEPSVEVFNYFLSCKKLKDLPLKKMLAIQCEVNEEAMVEFFNVVVNNTDKKTIIMDLPIYQNVFKKKYIQFSNRFMEMIKNKRSTLNANFVFKKSWIINSVNNFKVVLSTPNVITDNNGAFKGKTAILVSAGPSLDYEIENLRKIKEAGLAFIFSVGSAINTLIYHDIYPDAMCTYDPTELNQMVFKKVNEMKITSIPMVFGSSVGFEVLQQYQGPKFHMITSQDTISDYFLNEKDGRKIEKVHDAPTIAIVTLEMLYKLGFSTIVLVGQNLAYKDEKDYAEGIDYRVIVDSGNDKKILKTKDVEGNEVSTDDSFNSMRIQMESYIKSFNINLINTTIGGAHIEGTKFILMDIVIKDILNKRIVQGNEFENITGVELYDRDFLRTQLYKISKEFRTYNTIVTELKKNLDKLGELVKNKNVKQAIDTHVNFDALIRKMEENDFFKTIALPMNRVEYELLANNVQRIKTEKNDFLRAKLILKPIETFINLLYLDKNVNQQIIEVLTGTIECYTKKEER
ncbi:DUF115 domain-containing protein [Acetobacterium paludosum]|uniref:DUF115 domain-containing protein n=1 Tax=Acetobacterium paludosum TaxID=52693 RepID=A0A923HX38_9FIRM|nr:6-hydroxymethylpterin diphosphokinase MptE-like protein [Acetobacterium paludosum]MBC3888234.1 DUF115 domain-containing protein [Acetobacterium paludosum]